MAALAVHGGALAHLHGERGTAGCEPARQTRVGGGAQVVGVGDARVLVPRVHQFFEDSGVEQRGVEVTVAGRTPLERRIVRPLDGGQGVGVELGLLRLQEVQREAVDGEVGVLLQRGQGVALGVEAVHEDQRQLGAVLLARLGDLVDDDLEEVHAVAHRQQGFRLVQPHGRAQTAVEFDDDGLGQGRCLGLRVGGDVGQAGQFLHGRDLRLRHHTGAARGELTVVVLERGNRSRADSGRAHLLEGSGKTFRRVRCHTPDPRRRWVPSS